jgi:hypothetical protein
VLRHVTAYLKGIRVHKGTRLAAHLDIEARGLIYYRAPVTTGFRCRIPQGAVLVVYTEPSHRSLGFVCTIADPQLEARLVPSEDRLNTKYAGCAFSFGLGDIGRTLDIVAGQ